jgi:hypothetical protein
MRKPALRIGKLTFCKWHDCRGCQERGGFVRPVTLQLLQDIRIDAGTMSDIRRLVRTHDFCLDVSRMEDHEVLAQVVRLFESRVLRRCGDLENLPEERSSAQDQSELQVDAVIRVLAGSNRQLVFGGQYLRVIRAGHWRRIREEGRYQIVPLVEARQIISKLVGTPGVAPAEKDAWGVASEILAQPGAGRYDRGLLLLRIVPQRTFRSPATEPAITPSQLARLTDEKHWVDFRFKDSGGRPLPGTEYLITLPDGKDLKGRLNSQGKIRYEEQPSGDATVEILEIDAADWGLDEVDAHEPVELSAQVCPGFNPGESVKFDIYRLYRERDSDVVKSLTGTLDPDGRAMVSWTPNSTELPDDRFVFKASIRKIWRKSQILAVLHRIASAEWSSAQALEGDAITLRAVLRGIADGETATLKIFEKQWRGGQNTMIKSLSATVSGGAVEASWTVPSAEAPPPRGDSGRRDFTYTVEAAGLRCASTHVAVFPAQPTDGSEGAA